MNTGKIPIKNLNSEFFFGLNLKFLLLAFAAGAFFGIGYTVTKNIFISKFLTERSLPQNLSELETKKKLFDSSHALSKETEKKAHSHNKNYTLVHKKFKTSINSPTSEDSYLKLSIKYSKKQNFEKQKLFKNNLSFFKSQSVKSLMTSLNNTKHSKSSKVEAD